MTVLEIFEPIILTAVSLLIASCAALIFVLTKIIWKELEETKGENE